jgi:hypothetical protein
MGLSDFERKVLEGCRMFAPMIVYTDNNWHGTALSLSDRGLLKAHEYPIGSTYWPSYSITPEGLRALHEDLSRA